MAAFALTDTKILVGALDQSCFSDTIALDRQGETAEVTTFCSGGWRQFVPSLSSWSATFGGPQDLAASTAATQFAPDDHYALSVGSAYPITFVPYGDAEGAVAYGSQAILEQYTPLTGSVGDAAKHNVLARGYLNTPLVRGVFAAKATAASNSASSGFQLGAVSASQRVYAGVHILTVSGTTPTIDLIVQSDDNAGFTTPTNRIVFSTASTRSAQWSSLAGAVTDTYWRLLWLVAGTTPSFTIRAFIGIQ